MRITYLLALGVVLSNCSSKKFKSDTPKALVPPAPVESDHKPERGKTTTDEGVTGLKKACASDVGKLKSTTQTLNFPARQGCNWNVAPNLGIRDAHLQAAEKTELMLDLPKGKICEISISSPGTNAFEYDDVLILSIDAHAIFMSNRELTDRLEQVAGFYTWDFTKVVGFGPKDWEAPAYCIGDTNECSFPSTERPGPVTIDLPAEKFAPVALLISGKSSVPLTLTVIGDNDPDRDCRHKAIDLTIGVKYLP